MSEPPSHQDVICARRDGYRKGLRRALKVIEACVSRLPEIPAAVVADMLERRLTLEQVADEVDAMATDAELGEG
jgi:hypothetical protein